MKKSFVEISLLILIIFSINGCLKDAPTVPYQNKLDKNPEVLNYLEAHGDYINSDNFPSITDAQDVYNNLYNYLIIDVRSKNDFINGHIQNSINIQPDSLLIYMKSINWYSYPKIILVSGTGQSASYFGCLLILDGYSNVFAMKYGMASWNIIFSAPWDNATGNRYSDYLTKDLFEKARNTQLPSPSFPDSITGAKAKLEYQINKLLSEGFDDEIKTSYGPPVTDFSKSLADIQDQIDYGVCVGIKDFYGASHNVATSHPISSVSYTYEKPYLDFESAYNLQTLPSNKTICIYSYAGHISAFITAYLRILGYDARSILFGGNNIIYSGMLNTPDLAPYTFTSNDINNFPYVTGN